MHVQEELTSIQQLYGGQGWSRKASKPIEYRMADRDRCNNKENMEVVFFARASPNQISKRYGDAVRLKRQASQSISNGRSLSTIE
jgi:hypothetical protein